MNHQMVFKKLALSALLVSAVAAPTAANAANKSMDESPKATASAMIASTASQSVTAKAIGFWADPLEMAKTYAPNTLEDWKKTLEQYNKLTGLTLSVAVDSVSIKQGKVVELAKEILSEDSMSVGYIKAGPTLDLSVLETMVIEGKLGEGTNVSLIEAVEASPVTISSIEFSEADEAFYKAQDALGEAAKSKDAAAIKGALADLLVQYKEKIKELETAK